MNNFLCLCFLCPLSCYFLPSWLSSIPNADSSPPSPTFVPLSPPWSLVIITFGVCRNSIVKSVMKTEKLSLQQWGNIWLHVAGYLIWRDLKSVNRTKLPLRSEIGQSSQTTSSLTQIMSAICSCSLHFSDDAGPRGRNVIVVVQIPAPPTGELTPCAENEKYMFSSNLWALNLWTFLNLTFENHFMMSPTCETWIASFLPVENKKSIEVVRRRNERLISGVTAGAWFILCYLHIKWHFSAYDNNVVTEVISQNCDIATLIIR